MTHNSNNGFGDCEKEHFSDNNKTVTCGSTADRAYRRSRAPMSYALSSVLLGCYWQWLYQTAYANDSLVHEEIDQILTHDWDGVLHDQDHRLLLMPEAEHAMSVELDLQRLFDHSMGMKAGGDVISTVLWESVDNELVYQDHDYEEDHSLTSFSSFSTSTPHDVVVDHAQVMMIGDSEASNESSGGGHWLLPVAVIAGAGAVAVIAGSSSGGSDNSVPETKSLDSKGQANTDRPASMQAVMRYELEDFSDRTDAKVVIQDRSIVRPQKIKKSEDQQEDKENIKRIGEVIEEKEIEMKTKECDEEVITIDGKGFLSKCSDEGQATVIDNLYLVSANNAINELDNLSQSIQNLNTFLGNKITVDTYVYSFLTKTTFKNDMKDYIHKLDMAKQDLKNGGIQMEYIFQLDLIEGPGGFIQVCDPVDSGIPEIVGMIGNGQTVLIENENAKCLQRLDDVGDFTKAYYQETGGQVILSNSPNPVPFEKIRDDYDKLIVQIYDSGWPYAYDLPGYEEMFKKKIAPNLEKAKVEDVIFQFSLNASTQEGRIDQSNLSNNFVDFKNAFDGFYPGDTFNAGIWMTEDLSFFPQANNVIPSTNDWYQSILYIFDELVNRLKMLNVINDTFNSDDVDQAFVAKLLKICSKYTSELTETKNNNIPVFLKHSFNKLHDDSVAPANEISREIRDIKNTFDNMDLIQLYVPDIDTTLYKVHNGEVLVLQLQQIEESLLDIDSLSGQKSFGDMLVAPCDIYTKELRDQNQNGYEDRSEAYQQNNIVDVKLGGQSIKFMIKGSHLIVDAVTFPTSRCGKDANMLELVINDSAAYSACFDDNTTSVFARIGDVRFGGKYAWELIEGKPMSYESDTKGDVDELFKIEIHPEVIDIKWIFDNEKALEMETTDIVDRLSKDKKLAEKDAYDSQPVNELSNQGIRPGSVIKIDCSEEDISRFELSTVDLKFITWLEDYFKQGDDMDLKVRKGINLCINKLAELTADNYSTRKPVLLQTDSDSMHAYTTFPSTQPFNICNNIQAIMTIDGYMVIDANELQSCFFDLNYIFGEEKYADRLLNDYDIVTADFIDHDDSGIDDRMEYFSKNKYRLYTNDKEMKFDEENNIYMLKMDKDKLPDEKLIVQHFGGDNKSLYDIGCKVFPNEMSVQEVRERYKNLTERESMDAQPADKINKKMTAEIKKLAKLDDSVHTKKIFTPLESNKNPFPIIQVEKGLSVYEYMDNYYQISIDEILESILDLNIIVPLINSNDQIPEEILNDFNSSYPSQLSGGTQQRIGIAQDLEVELKKHEIKHFTGITKGMELLKSYGINKILVNDEKVKFKTNKEKFVFYWEEKPEKIHLNITDGTSDHAFEYDLFEYMYGQKDKMLRPGNWDEFKNDDKIKKSYELPDDEMNNLIENQNQERELSRNEKNEILPVTDESHLSFEVTPGMVVGLLGPNGAGKTTITKMIKSLDEDDKISFENYQDEFVQHFELHKTLFDRVFLEYALNNDLQLDLSSLRESFEEVARIAYDSERVNGVLNKVNETLDLLNNIKKTYESDVEDKPVTDLMEEIEPTGYTSLYSELPMASRLTPGIHEDTPMEKPYIGYRDERIDMQQDQSEIAFEIYDDAA